MGRIGVETRGVLLGAWDETDFPAALWKGYLGDKVPHRKK
jgi:hypothetical protein